MSNEMTVQFIKDRLRSALSNLNHSALNHAELDDTAKRWFESWLTPDATMQEAYKRPVFDSYGFVHYSPKDGDARPRYGVQAVLNGPLFESRKEFRSLRLARLWVKQQMRCKCWPITTDAEQYDAQRMITMNVTFDYQGPLDTTRLEQSNAK